MIKVKIKLLNQVAKIPKQATEFAAGWDVVCTEIEEPENGTHICKLGFALQIPHGYKVMFAPRSSITKTRLVLQNSPCIGDSDFTREYQLRFKTIPSIPGESWFMPFPYKVGERIGQMWLEKIIDIDFEEVDEIQDTGRGSYGSSGR